MSGVEEQVAIGGGADNGRAIRGGRAQAGPEFGTADIAALRVEIVGDHLQGGAASRVERQVETGDLGHAADADAVVEAGDGDLVGLVEDGRGRRHRRIGDRHGQRVALERVDRRLDAQRLEQLRAVAAEGEHVAVGGFQLAVDPHAVDAVASVVQALDVAAEAEFDAEVLGHLRQLAGEHLAVAGLVVGQAQGAGQLVLDPGQGRFDAGDGVAVEQLVGHAGGFQHGDVLGRVVDLGLGAEQLGGAQLAAFIGDAGFGAQLVEAVTAVLGQAHHALLVHRVAGSGAVAQHLRHPQVLVDIGGGLDRQRRVLLQQPLDGLQRHARGSPGRGVAGRNLAGVGEAGFQGRAVLAVDHHHLEAGTGQIVGTGGTDHTAAEHQNTHLRLLAAGRARERLLF